MQMQETLVDKILLHRIYTYTCMYMHVILIAVDMLLCSYLITLQDIASVITFLLQCATNILQLATLNSRSLFDILYVKM